jgi:hypothetical protein
MKKIFVLLFVSSIMCSTMAMDIVPFACVDAQYSGNNLRALAKALKDRRDMSPLMACFLEEEPDLHMIDGSGEGYLSECPVGQKIPFRGNLRCLNDKDCVISHDKNGVCIADGSRVGSFAGACTVVGNGEDLLLVANDGSLHSYAAIAAMREREWLPYNLVIAQKYRSTYDTVDSSHVSPTGLLPMRFQLGGASSPLMHVGLYDVMQQTLVRLIDFKKIHKDSTRILARPCDQTMVVISKEGFSHFAELYDPRTGALEKNVTVKVGSSGYREHFGRVVRDPDWLVPAHNLNTLVAVYGSRSLCQCDWRQEKLQGLWPVGGEGLYESGAISDDGTKVAVVLEDSTRETYQSLVHEITGLADVGASVAQPEYKKRYNFKVQFSNRDAQPEDDLNEQALDLVGEDPRESDDEIVLPRTSIFASWLGRWNLSGQ